MIQQPIAPIPRDRMEIEALKEAARQPPMKRIGVVHGDILSMKRVDAIVNAANRHLTPGGGLSGAIHKAAGPQLEKFCALHRDKNLNPSHAVTTHGGRLHPVNIIHAIGAKWDDTQESVDITNDAYRNAIEEATRFEFRVIAMPILGAGLYGWPLDKAVETAILAVIDGLYKQTFPNRVVFVAKKKSHCLALRDYLHRFINGLDLPLIPVAHYNPPISSC